MTADSKCERCGLPSGTFGNCPASPPCKPHPLGPRCKECGAPDFAGAVCPTRPHISANVGGLGWRSVTNYVRDCIRHEDGQEAIEKLITEAYARHAAKKEPETPAPGIL